MSKITQDFDIKQQWQELDNAVRGLLSRGVALEDIVAHITGGEQNG